MALLRQGWCALSPSSRRSSVPLPFSPGKDTLGRASAKDRRDHRACVCECCREGSWTCTSRGGRSCLPGHRGGATSPRKRQWPSRATTHAHTHTPIAAPGVAAATCAIGAGRATAGIAKTLTARMLRLRAGRSCARAAPCCTTSTGPTHQWSQAQRPVPGQPRTQSVRSWRCRRATAQREGGGRCWFGNSEWG